MIAEAIRVPRPANKAGRISDYARNVKAGAADAIRQGWRIRSTITTDGEYIVVYRLTDKNQVDRYDTFEGHRLDRIKAATPDGVTPGEWMLYIYGI